MKYFQRQAPILLAILWLAGCAHHHAPEVPSTTDFPEESCSTWVQDDNALHNDPDRDTIYVTLRCFKKRSKDLHPLRVHGITFQYIVDPDRSHYPERILRMEFFLGKISPEYASRKRKPIIKRLVGVEYQFDDEKVMSDHFVRADSSHIIYRKDISTSELYQWLDDLMDSDIFRFEIDGEKAYTIPLTGFKGAVKVFKQEYEALMFRSL